MYENERNAHKVITVIALWNIAHITLLLLQHSTFAIRGTRIVPLPAKEKIIHETFNLCRSVVVVWNSYGCLQIGHPL